jgi:hypothetical protein
MVIARFKLPVARRRPDSPVPPLNGTSTTNQSERWTLSTSNSSGVGHETRTS